MLNQGQIPRKLDKNLKQNAHDEFVPIACFYNEFTILTKNSDLIQTIIIGSEESEKDILLHESIQKAIIKNVSDNNISFWIHTVRRPEDNVKNTSNLSNHMLTILNELLQKNLPQKFSNIVFISIVHKFYLKDFLNHHVKIHKIRGYKSIQNIYNNKLQKHFDVLNPITDGITKDLSGFGAKKVGIEFNDNVPSSTALDLYHYLINFTNKKLKLPLEDLSKYLIEDVYMVKNDILVINSVLEPKYVSIFSIKEFSTISTSKIQNALKLPIEYCISETIKFTNKEKLLSRINQQRDLLTASGDSDLHFALLLEDNSKSQNDWNYIASQLSFTICASSETELLRNRKALSEVLSNFGIIHVLEDINLESLFWSNIPANFSYIRSNRYTLANTIALMVCNKYNENASEAAYSLISQIVGINALISSDMKNLVGLANSIVASNMSYQNDILYLSCSNRSKIFIECIDGKWSNSPSINPFSIISLVPHSKEYVKSLLSILAWESDINLDNNVVELIDKLADKMLDLPHEYQDISHLFQNSPKARKGFTKNLQKLMSSDVYSKYTTTPPIEENIVGYNFSLFNEYKNDEDYLVALNVKASIIFALMYKFLYRETNVSTKRIIFIDDIDKIIDHPFLGKIFISLLQLYKEKNIIVIMGLSTTNANTEESKRITKEIINFCDTRIIMDGSCTFINQMLGVNINSILPAVSSKDGDLRVFSFNPGNDLGKCLNVISADDECIELYDLEKQDNGKDLESIIKKLLL